MLIQLATRLTNLTVIATASRQESVRCVRQLSAEHVADHNEPLDQSIRSLGSTGVDLIAAVTTTPESIVGFIEFLRRPTRCVQRSDYEARVISLSQAIRRSFEMIEHMFERLSCYPSL